MHLGAEDSSSRDTPANLHCFHRLQRHHGSGQKAIQSLIPVGIGSQTWRHAVRYDFKDSAYGIAGPQHLIHHCLHPLLGSTVDAIQQDLIALLEGGDFLPGGLPIKLLITDPDYMTCD